MLATHPDRPTDRHTQDFRWRPWVWRAAATVQLVANALATTEATSLNHAVTTGPPHPNASQLANTRSTPVAGAIVARLRGRTVMDPPRSLIAASIFLRLEHVPASLRGPVNEIPATE
ncbi:hypothetical protein JCM12141A_20130 [Mycolicibacterium hodleri]